ncbi:nose resistant to fluoxetine protein 6-like [Arctopsyche grandis]|uniref:nose resistant to fluoxetine protein 6-like n=1 Tax=Arctopsyche grandis TaxID=121162 RepID=UPI00406D7A56
MPTFDIVQNVNVFGSENRSGAMQDDSDPLMVLAGLQSVNVLSKSVLHKKAMSVNPDVGKPTFFNLTELEKKLDFPVNYGLSTVLSSDILALKSGVENLENSLCKNQSLLLLRGMLLGKNWALKMYDASAKSPNGLLWGATFQLGNFDECLSIQGHETEENSLVAQYCLANVQFKKQSTKLSNSNRLGPRDDIHWGICVPSACSSNEVRHFISNLLISAGNSGKVTIPPENCYKKQPIEINTLDIVYGSFLIGFIILLFSCTCFHLYFNLKNKAGDKKSKTIVESVIVSFSIVENLKKIFSVKQQNDIGLNSIAGIRTLAMFFILAGHALIFIVGGPVMNSKLYDDMIIRPENSVMLNSPLLVDTFLFISAFLFCRLLLAEFDKRKGRVNVLPIYVFRYIRVTSSYVIVILLYMTWLDKIDGGPLWNMKVGVEKQRCLESWWTNILYINNYVNTNTLCMFQSWYVAVDTQLFFLAPIVIYPLWKWRRFGEILLVFLTVATTIIPFVITYQDKLDPTLMPFSKEVFDISTNKYFEAVYMKTHMKACVYCVGLAFGYILYRIQTTGYKLSKKVLIFGWITSIVCSTSALFGVSVFYQVDYEYNPMEAAIYNSLHHIAWAIGNGWLLIVCATKNAGFIDSFFSWKPFIPISRLTYCAYLINGVIELYLQGTLRNSIHISIYSLVRNFLSFSHICQTFIGAVILCVMFESPLHGIEKILLKTIGRNKHVTSTKEIPNTRYNKNEEKY